MPIYFELFKSIAYVFATLMLFKYFLYLVLAPLHPVKEILRKIKIKRESNNRPYHPKISVITPAWNEQVGILKTITSVLENTYTNKELIVVNDGSTDHSDQIVKDYLKDLNKKSPHLREQIRYFYKQNGGKGSALNYGIKRATGDVILTVDADSALDSKALENLSHYYADSTLDAVVGNVKISKNPTLIGFIQKLEYIFGFYYKRAHSVMGAEYIFGGACASFRKQIFDHIGLFDTKNKTEDIEMTLRVRAHGYNCTFAEDVICYTEGASTIMGLVNQRLRWKKGRFDAFVKYRNLFFSTQKGLNKAMTFLVLPYSLIGELQLLFEPISISLLASYSIISGDYLSFTLGLMFLFIIYLVNAFFTHDGLNLKMLILFPLTWPLFYFLVLIEYFALLHSIRLIFRGQNITWQNWQRQGVLLAA